VFGGDESVGEGSHVAANAQPMRVGRAHRRARVGHPASR
jgi:hypothetical protein